MRDDLMKQQEMESREETEIKEKYMFKLKSLMRRSRRKQTGQEHEIIFAKVEGHSEYPPKMATPPKLEFT